MKLCHDYKVSYQFNFGRSVDNETIERSVMFWVGQGFECSFQGSQIMGVRGTEEGNKKANDMWKIYSQVKVNFSGSAVECEVVYNGIYQWFTDWDSTLAQLELIKFREYLNNNTNLTLFTEFRNDALKAGELAKKFFGLYRKKMPKVWNDKISKLATPLPEIVDIGKSQLNGKDFIPESKMKWKYLILWMGFVFIVSFFKRVYWQE